MVDHPILQVAFRRLQGFRRWYPTIVAGIVKEKGLSLVHHFWQEVQASDWRFRFRLSAFI